MDIYADLAFLKSILSFVIRTDDDVETKFENIVCVIYNQLETKEFKNKRAAEIAARINPQLVIAVASGFMNCVELYGKEKAIRILEKNLREQITSVTEQTNDELTHELVKAVAFSDLMIHGIHIDNTGETNNG